MPTNIADFIASTALLLLLACLAIPGCSGDQDDDDDDGYDGDDIDLSAVDDWTYWLSDIDLLELGNSAFDLAVIDYSQGGEESGEWSPEQIADLRASAGGDKLALAYLSIGEAEDYRFYWDQDWLDQPPDWLGPENPDWTGNYKVRYWMDGWQRLILGQNGYLERIMDMGFDGVYLDIIDAYEFWGPEGLDQKDDAADQMVRFVDRIAQQARQVNPDFIVLGQNGLELAELEPEYLEIIDGVGAEDTFFDGDDPQPADDVEWTVELLDLYLQRGLIVLAIDYCRKSDNVDRFYRMALEHGYVPYSSQRDLEQLTIDLGHEPD
ncbi:MAG: endo alpha-1,4 polygalactosaminidase [Candidatus Alcyoniella australis]|nr:endo alpha-1,4 polygalactosaminidase [Candidatus Alcyoniella australis]